MTAKLYLKFRLFLNRWFSLRLGQYYDKLEKDELKRVRRMLKRNEL